MPDNYLTLAQQVAAKQESTSGTAVSLAAADVKLRSFVSSLNFTADLPRFTNDEVAEDIGVAADFVGGLAGRLGVGCAFHGSGAIGTVPSIGIYLEACGCKNQLVKQITIGSISGGDTQFKRGETYSASSDTKTGIIEADITGAGALKYIIVTGSALENTDVVTANGDSATCSGSSTDYAQKYSPLSYGHKTLTLQRATRNSAGTASQDYLMRLRGALGTARIECQALDAMRFLGEFQGAIDYTGNGSLFTGVTYETRTTGQQPKLSNATLQLNGVAIRPSQFTFDLGANVAMDPDPTTTGGATGYDFARILGREPKITVDPFRTPTGTLDDLGFLKSGNTFAVQLVTGTTPDIIEINAPACQLRGWGEQERVGRHVANLELVVTRGTLTDEDWWIYFR